MSLINSPELANPVKVEAQKVLMGLTRNVSEELAQRFYQIAQIIAESLKVKNQANYEMRAISVKAAIGSDHVPAGDKKTIKDAAKEMDSSSKQFAIEAANNKAGLKDATTEQYTPPARKMG